MCFLGLVVFLVLLIVNFIVITKGAGRMAEVGARFALDGMPGKQLAIDADVASGAITHEEAKARREREQQETTFFGSLDGASKFVKGDAIAGLLITLLNIIMGLIMGVAVHGMDIGRAFETYAILTVGDGLVSQIPAVIISIAAALLLARGGATGSTDLALFSQLGRYPAALGTVAVLLGLFALVPGPCRSCRSCSGRSGSGPPPGGGIAGRWQQDIRTGRRGGDGARAETGRGRAARNGMGDVLDLDDIHVEFATDLVTMVLDPATGLDARIANMRNHVAAVYGLILPEIRLTDDPSLPARHLCGPDPGGGAGARHPPARTRVLAILTGSELDLPPGDDVEEPVYGAPARWVAAERPGRGGAPGLHRGHAGGSARDPPAGGDEAQLRPSPQPAGTAPVARRVLQPVGPGAGRGQPASCSTNWCPTGCRSICCCRYCDCCWKSVSRSGTCP